MERETFYCRCCRCSHRRHRGRRNQC